MNQVKYLPLLLFLASGVKTLILTPSIHDGIALLVLGAVAAFYEFKTQDQKIVKLEQNLEQLSKQIKELSKDIEDTRNHVAGLKIGQQLRNTNGVR